MKLPTTKLYMRSNEVTIEPFTLQRILEIIEKEAIDLSGPYSRAHLRFTFFGLVIHVEHTSDNIHYDHIGNIQATYPVKAPEDFECIRGAFLSDLREHNFNHLVKLKGGSRITFDGVEFIRCQEILGGLEEIFISLNDGSPHHASTLTPDDRLII